MFLIFFRNILCPQQMFSSLRSPRNMGDNVSATMCPRLPTIACRTGVIFCVFRRKRREGEPSAKRELRARGGALKNPACPHTIVQAVPAFKYERGYPIS